MSPSVTLCFSKSSTIAAKLSRELGTHALVWPVPGVVPADHCGGARRSSVDIFLRDAEHRHALVQVRPTDSELHGSYAQPLDVTQLAEEAGMSVPSFHTHFKAITTHARELCHSDGVRWCNVCIVALSSRCRCRKCNTYRFQMAGCATLYGSNAAAGGSASSGLTTPNRAGICA